MPEEDRTAEVVLRPASGVEMSEPITSANVAAALPDPAVAARVRAWFEQAGFQVGPAGPLSFSISGPASLFETHLGSESAGGSASGGGTTFDAGALPADIAGAVEAVITSAPPDFGPTNP
jgi:hypothetical protein